MVSMMGAKLLAAADRMGLQGWSRSAVMLHTAPAHDAAIKTKTKAWRETNKMRQRLFERA